MPEISYVYPNLAKTHFARGIRKTKSGSIIYTKVTIL